jgi:hypothetical protein
MLYYIYVHAPFYCDVIPPDYSCILYTICMLIHAPIYCDIIPFHYLTILYFTRACHLITAVHCPLVTWFWMSLWYIYIYIYILLINICSISLPPYFIGFPQISHTIQILQMRFLPHIHRGCQGHSLNVCFKNKVQQFSDKFFGLEWFFTPYFLSAKLPERQPQHQWKSSKYIWPEKLYFHKYFH